ncbi:hypothetical protein TELCIR_17332, partial [Teladorsagia circumcincta]
RMSYPHAVRRMKQHHFFSKGWARALPIVVGSHGDSDVLPPFLTVKDFLRSSEDEEVFLTPEDFRNGELLANSTAGNSTRLLSRQSFLHGDIRGKAAWKL